MDCGGVFAQSSTVSSNGVAFYNRRPGRGLLEAQGTHGYNQEEVLADTALRLGNRARAGTRANGGGGIEVEIHIVGDRNRMAERSGTE
jgi:hypothetical protein